MNKIKMWALAVAMMVVVAVAGTASGQVVTGNKIKPASGPDAGVCDVTTEFGTFGMLGGDAGTGDSKLCICKSDGAGVYQWCSITLTGASNVVCAGGDAVTCP